ncbi:MAG: amidohydrolase family protein [Acidobacteria bacterium]|nr:amidohydrolase family protein [Acidobacteriota bacterium]
MPPTNLLSRRTFLAAASACLLSDSTPLYAAEPIIDIHQHTNYSGRTNEQLIAHQREMGITKTVLLPAGSKYGLAAGAGGNQTVVDLARQYPKEYVYFANELPDIPGARQEIEKYLKMGAIGIGEQKFHVPCDSPPIEGIAEVAQQFGVPVLLHFQHETYNLGIENFHKILKKFPKVNFIGHAQTWWGNIDKNHDQKVMYPKTPVTPGGLTDRLLSDYPNMYGDLSAGSGLNALLRDEAHAREFLARHQDKLLYGSDCSDPFGKGEKCSGSQQIATVRRLAPSPAITRKIFYSNAVRVLKIKV